MTDPQIDQDDSSKFESDPDDARRQFLNFGEEDQMEIDGYRISQLKNILTWVFYFLTLGLLRLLFHWYPQWQLVCTHSKCPLEIASNILITDDFKGKYKSYFVKKIVLLNANESSRKISDKDGVEFEKRDEKLMTFNLNNGAHKEVGQARVFWCKKMCYVWDPDRKRFFKLAGLDRGFKCSDLRAHEGHTTEEQQSKRAIYGENQIVVPVKSITTLLVLEALTPFYIFQVFSLIVWFSESYYYYTIAIIVMSVFGITLSIVQTRKNQKNLKGTVQSTDKVTVRRKNGLQESIPTSYLVPGDVIVIPSHGCVMHCDAVLLNGNCIVNESMLTGESVPVTKSPLPATNSYYNVKEDCNHTLYCGTKVIQTRFYGEEDVLALVIRTGFLTSKGQLVRSILYPPPVDFKFDQDSYKFIGILTVVAFAGVVYTVVSKSTRNISPLDILIKALDLITIAIPPALPAAMTVGKLYALGRLKKCNIYCINSRVINVSGSINCICFDKTGTLTEDGLDMWGVVPVAEDRFGAAIRDAKDLSCTSSLLRGMVACHSLTYIDEELIGDPLDLKMFESTGWVLEEPEVADSTKYDLLVPTIVKSSPKETAFEIGLVHQYQFQSNLQRMSVVTRTLGSPRFEVFCKGSPETIIGLSKPQTVPGDAFERLTEYTAKGYRVIAIARRLLDEDVNYHKLRKIPREQIERDLDFVGLVILENRLKPGTTSVIAGLKEAGMKIVMITGDNIQTAISVARECGIIEKNQIVFEVNTCQEHKSGNDELRYTVLSSGDKCNFANDIDLMETGGRSNCCLAMTGRSWGDVRKKRPDLVPELVANGAVFARTSSDQKQQLVQEMQNLGYYVAMCGDGANDCGALKAAHVGISLSEAESSVASPFTSKDQDIACVNKVVREGRAALVTSFGVFKFMLCYSLTEFTSVILLYGIDSNLTSMQFLFIDICLILNFASFFGKTKAYAGPLAKVRPMTSLLGFIPLVSITLNIFLTVVFQIVAYHIVKTYSWYEPFVYDPERSTYFSCYENTSVFSISMFQYITAAVVFSKGNPYRKSIFSNKTFLSIITAMTIICAYISLYPADWVKNVLGIKQPPLIDGPIAVLLLAGANFLCCFLVEDLLVEYLIKEKIRPLFRDADSSRKPYSPIVGAKGIVDANRKCDKVLCGNVDEIIKSNNEHSNKNVAEARGNIYNKSSVNGHSNMAFEVDDDVVTTRI